MADDLQGRLREWREEAGLTQEMVAYRSGLSVATIQRIERGAIPKIQTLRQIALVLGVPWSKLAEVLGDATTPDDDEPSVRAG